LQNQLNWVFATPNSSSFCLSGFRLEAPLVIRPMNPWCHWS
jgi:hypothetical protein